METMSNEKIKTESSESEDVNIIHSINNSDEAREASSGSGEEEMTDRVNSDEERVSTQENEDSSRTYNDIGDSNLVGVGEDDADAQGVARDDHTIVLPPAVSGGELAGSTDDPFNLKRLRLSQSFSDTIGVKKLLLTVPVRKPNRQWFIRVHHDPDFHFQTAVLELKDEGETYLVEPSLWPELGGEIHPLALYTAVNRQGVTFLWPIRLPGDDGRIDDWNRVALEAAQMAQSRWIRVTANRALGTYEVAEAVAAFPEPEWPEGLDFKDLLKIAFKDRFIESLDHPVVRQLMGAV